MEEEKRLMVPLTRHEHDLYMTKLMILYAYFSRDASPIVYESIGETYEEERLPELTRLFARFLILSIFLTLSTRFVQQRAHFWASSSPIQDATALEDLIACSIVAD